MIDQEKFGKFVASLRKEAGLTQEELAAKLYVGREAVSKWERGVGLPGHVLLLELSKEFNVTINELLYGERKNEDNEEEVEVAAYKWLDIISAKVHSWKKLFIITIILVIIIYLVSCLVFEYNSFKVYTTYTSSDSYIIKSGVIIKYHNQLYFKFGNTNNYTEDDIIDMSLYYGNKDNNERIKLTSSNILDDYTANINDLENMTNKNLKDILKNLYIIISTSSGEEEYKIEVDLKFKTNIMSEENKDNAEDIDDNIETFSDNPVEDSIKSKFKLKDGKYIYEFKYKKKTYKCTLEEDIIYFLYNKVTIRYKVGSNEIIIDNGDFYYYDINNNKCISGDCKKYKDIINAFIKNVLE